MASAVRRENVLKTDDLKTGGKLELFRVADDAHQPRVRRVAPREYPILSVSEYLEVATLIGGERQCDSPGLQKFFRALEREMSVFLSEAGAARRAAFSVEAGLSERWRIGLDAVPDRRRVNYRRRADVVVSTGALAGFGDLSVVCGSFRLSKSF